MTPLRLLVVDDDVDLLRAFQRSFGRQYDVAVADSGENALLLLAQQPVDVLIVDYSMPGMSGVEVLKAAAERYPGVGRLMLTAYADFSEVLDCKALGLASAVLHKPWERASVESAISKAHQLALMRSAVERMKSGVR